PVGVPVRLVHGIARPVRDCAGGGQGLSAAEAHRRRLDRRFVHGWLGRVGGRADRGQNNRTDGGGDSAQRTPERPVPHIRKTALFGTLLTAKPAISGGLLGTVARPGSGSPA